MPDPALPAPARLPAAGGDATVAAAHGLRPAPAERGLRLVFLGLSITSSWGNGHATTYRGLVRELCRRGHEVLFLERDVPYYAACRDLPAPPYGRTALYGSLDELRRDWTAAVAEADAVIVGSYVPDGIAVGRWVAGTTRGLTAFYDIDTPVTLEALARGNCSYLTPELIPRYDLYLSFTGGPTLGRLEREFGSPAARALYCSVDGTLYRPAAGAGGPGGREPDPPRWELGYMGTYSADRQPGLERLLLDPARHRPRAAMVVAGPQYPDSVRWPGNVARIDHVPPGQHPEFYHAQAFTLNLTRTPMRRLGWSPSVRLFEAAACGVPILTDPWPGLEEFFTPGEDLFVVGSGAQVEEILREVDAPTRRETARRARARILKAHTAAHRAATLEGYVRERTR